MTPASAGVRAGVWASSGQAKVVCVGAPWAVSVGGDQAVVGDVDGLAVLGPTRVVQCDTATTPTRSRHDRSHHWPWLAYTRVSVRWGCPAPLGPLRVWCGQQKL